MPIWLSRVDEQPVALVYKSQQVRVERVTLGTEADTLQSSAKRLNAGREFRPHVHWPVERATIGTQEVWVVVSGSVRALLYDVDDTYLDEVVLVAGDCLVALRGGHGMVVIEDDTLLYEFKNGPYFGQEADKRLL